MRIRRPHFLLSTPACLWLVAATLLLPSCAPDPGKESAAVADKFFGRVAHEISPALYARLGSPPGAGGRNQSVALVFLDGGAPPPTATCATDLKAGLEKQLTMLAARAGIRLRLTSNVDEAAVVIAIGDTLHEFWIKDRRLDALMSARHGADGTTSLHSHDFGIPGFPSPDFLEGLFTNSNDRLISGLLRIHWSVTATPRGAEAKDCAFDFIARLARLYSLALADGFGSEYSQAWRAARTQTGLSAYEVPNTGLEEYIGLYFCAQFVGAAELAECSAQAVKLMTNMSR